MTPQETIAYLQTENNPDLWELYAWRKEIYRHTMEIDGRMVPEITWCSIKDTPKNRGMRNFLRGEQWRRRVFDVPFCKFKIWRLERRVKLRPDVNYETWLEVDR